MSETTGNPPAAAVLQGSQDFLRGLQKLLGAMGADQERRKSPEFQQVMANYKELGLELHEARKRMPPVEKRVAGPVAARSPGVTALRPAPAGSGAPVSRLPLGARAAGQKPGGVTGAAPAVTPGRAAGLAAHAYGKGSVAGEARDAAPAEAAAVTTEAAARQASARAAQAYGGKPAPATRAPDPAGLQHVALPAMAGPAPVGAQPVSRAAQAYGVSAGLPAAEAQEALPSGLPLQMARFKSALGPASPKTVYRGPELDNLQALLIHLGYQLKPTGTFDLPTLRAVNVFQKNHKIPITTVVGSEMRRLLNDLVTG